MRPSPLKEPKNPSPPQHRPLNRCQTGVWHYSFCFSIIRYKRIGFTGNLSELGRNPSSLTFITVGAMAAIDITSLVALYSCTVTNPARRRGSAIAQPLATVDPPQLSRAPPWPDPSPWTLSFSPAFSLFLTGH
ncbi:hypothetical protein Hanom_Chr12g01110151 [Helianthus anomalus]